MALVTEGGSAIEPLMAEAYRLRLLRGVEDRLSTAGFRRVAGVDEAGRGALAGPVVVAAVVMPDDSVLPGVDDSKALSPEARETLAGLIRERAVAWSVALSHADEIDRFNILRSTQRAMIEALASLRPGPDCAVVDAVKLPGLPFPTLPFVRGDSLCYSIACASILAKVARDRWMVETHEAYPQYGFDEHKGYAAPRHREALRRYGATPVHRLTFGSVVPRAGEAAA